MHEINHYIEEYEKYNKKSRGANLIEKDRKNNLGEIISDEAKIYSEFTQEELNDIIDLEQMKENPNYKNYSQRLIQRNNLDFKKINEDVISKDDNNSLVPKNNTENIIYTKKKNGEERQNNRLKLYDEELDNSSFSFDNKGRQLTKAQQEYFKNSVVKDEKGNLKVVYHGTPLDFNKFSYDFVGANGTALGKGFYLTDSLSMAKGFSKEGKEPMQLYVNITNPMSLNEKTISKQQFKEYFSSASIALICSLSNLTLSFISLYIFKK